MLVYHYRIFDRFRAPVLSLAILADERPSWRPDHFETGAFGTSLRLDFRSLKLLDWEAHRSELESSRNPFAAVVLAHLDSLRTKGKPARRFARKWALVRRLFGLGYNRQDVIFLFRFLDEVLRLPEPLEIRFRDRLGWRLGLGRRREGFGGWRHRRSRFGIRRLGQDCVGGTIGHGRLGRLGRRGILTLHRGGGFAGTQTFAPTGLSTPKVGDVRLTLNMASAIRSGDYLDGTYTLTVTNL